MSARIEVTPLEALRHLVDVARLIDADECPELYNELQSVLTVAGAVLAEPQPEPIGVILEGRFSNRFEWASDEIMIEGSLVWAKVYATPVAAQPPMPKLPSTPAEAIVFIGSNFGSIDVEGPLEDRCIRLSVHDLLSAFSVLAMDAEEAAQPSESPQRITQAQIDYIGEAIRAELAKLNSAPTAAVSAAPSGDVERERDRYKSLVIATQEAILTYYDGLSARKHGGIEQCKAFETIELALGMNWQPGVDHRAAITATKE